MTTSAAERLAANLNFGLISRATELKKRLWFTIGALVIFRLLSYVPLPGIDPTALGLLSQQTQGCDCRERGCSAFRLLGSKRSA